MPYNASTGVFTSVSGAETASAGNVIQSAVWDNNHADYRTAFTQLGQGTIAPPSTALTLVNGLNSNIGFPTTARGRVTGPSGAFSVGGFTGGADGLRLYLYNNVSQTMTIVNEDASSTAANRIKTNTGVNIVLQAGSTSYATFSYDGTVSRWVLESTGPQPNTSAPSGSTISVVNPAPQIVNFAASISDVATFTINLPVSVSTYKFNSLKIYNAAGSLGAPTVALFTGAGGTGTQVITSTATTITSSLAQNANSQQSITSGIGNTTMFNAPQLFLRVMASLATSTTASAIINIEPNY